MSIPRRALAPTLLAALLAACASPGSSPQGTDGPGPSEGGTLTIYSGRSEELVGPLLQQFQDATGTAAEVRYGDSAEMASQILTEGDNSPADVFFSQDAGALGALAQEGVLAELPDPILERVDERFRSPSGEWVGVSGRARVVAYNPDNVSEDELPDSILDFTDPRWEGRIGWAPTNSSFQAFVTALRQLEGEETARAWLEGIQANDPKVYEGNNPALQAVAAGEVDVAFINHYYLLGARSEDPDINAENHFLPGGDPGALINVAGAGILATSDDESAAQRFVEYLLSEDAQRYFADETFEYPLVEGVQPNEALPSLAEVESPDIDLSDLADLQGTLALLEEVGVI